MEFELESPPEGMFVYRTETFYDQLDGQMVLHHPRYMVFVERAQQAWIEKVLGAPRFDWVNFPDMYLVVRRLEIDYLQSVNGVMDLAVCLWCRNIRAGTMEVCFEIRNGSGKSIFAKGIRYNAKIRASDHRPEFWTERFRERFERLTESAQSWRPF